HVVSRWDYAGVFEFDDGVGNRLPLSEAAAHREDLSVAVGGGKNAGDVKADRVVIAVENVGAGVWVRRDKARVLDVAAGVEREIERHAGQRGQQKRKQRNSRPLHLEPPWTCRLRSPNVRRSFAGDESLGRAAGPLVPAGRDP